MGLLSALVCAGCGHDGMSGSQNGSADTLSRFSATLVEEVMNSGNGSEEMTEEQRQLIDAVAHSRRNAITNAVEEVSPTVVSITVTEVVEGRGTAQDEFFRYFFGEGIPREFTNMGSGFIISEDGLVVT
ncbi:MAG: hypothetical protein WD317_11790, partial [Balneolaceae bacterium]